MITFGMIKCFLNHWLQCGTLAADDQVVYTGTPKSKQSSQLCCQYYQSKLDLAHYHVYELDKSLVVQD